MKIHRDLKVTQKTAWSLAHRIRASWVVRDHHDVAALGRHRVPVAALVGHELLDGGEDDAASGGEKQNDLPRSALLVIVG